MSEQDSIPGGYNLSPEAVQAASELAHAGVLWQSEDEIPDWLAEKMPDDQNMEEKMAALFFDIPKEEWPDESALLEYINKTRMFWVREWKEGRLESPQTEA